MTLAKSLQAAAGNSMLPNYIEDVFSTYLYTGNSSTQTINNGIDLAGEGGLVWLKGRSLAVGHYLYDTNRGIANGPLSSANTNEAYTANTPKTLTSFNSDGFSMQDDSATFGANVSPRTQVSWTFRKQPKFFDVVTYTGDGVAGRQIAHSLGVAPGMIIVKATSLAGDNWFVYHRGLDAVNPSHYTINLNFTDARTDTANAWYDTEPTSSVFTVGSGASWINQSGQTYVAYIFAHDAGGFGESGEENVVSCGSFTTDSSTDAFVSLGYEPQWLMIKNSANAGGWIMVDNMRGLPVGSADPYLMAQSSNAEATSNDWANITATGFYPKWFNLNTTSTYIYIAIRRGPMKVPTDGTKVFAPVIYTGNSSTQTLSGFGFSPDAVLLKNRISAPATGSYFVDKLRGGGSLLNTPSTNEELVGFGTTIFNQDGITLPALLNINGSETTYIDWAFRRAPGFFDEVCYTGTGVATTVAHNLGVAPELMLVKNRSNITNWTVYNQTVGATARLRLNTVAEIDVNSTVWNNTAPTASVFTVGTNSDSNTSSNTYVNYLFASCPGVSKVFSFTGNGSSQTINCGFTAGSRFILIKCTSTTGDWYVWDTARGIVANSDPHLSLNTTAAEVTTDDTIDPDSSGFIVNQVAATNVNVNGATYIGLAIA